LASDVKDVSDKSLCAQVASATAINYSRHVNIGIELVVLEHVVLTHDVPETVRVPISEGCYITGLSLVAAGWDPESESNGCILATHTTRFTTSSNISPLLHSSEQAIIIRDAFRARRAS